MGHGEKSVIWYSVFDTREEYFHEFKTWSFTDAMDIYEKSRFEMLDGLWGAEAFVERFA
jgi:hypothetical protein